MPIPKVCPRCNTTFLTKGRVDASRRRYCSYACRASNIIRDCLHCGKSFTRPPAQIRKQQYCSQECYRKVHSDTSKVCPGCNKEFLVKRSQSKRRKFCSRNCPGRSITKRCHVCDKLFTIKMSDHLSRKWICCSRMCSLTNRRITKVCLSCNKSFETRRANASQKYCSRPCWINAKIGNSNFGRCILTYDGHIVRSKAEQIVDDWLYEHQIAHIYEPRLPFESSWHGDFFANGYYIEIWGEFNGESKLAKTYQARKARKIKAYRKHNIPLIEIESHEITKHLDHLLWYLI